MLLYGEAELACVAVGGVVVLLSVDRLDHSLFLSFRPPLCSLHPSLLLLLYFGFDQLNRPSSSKSIKGVVNNNRTSHYLVPDDNIRRLDIPEPCPERDQSQQGRDQDVIVLLVEPDILNV